MKIHFLKTQSGTPGTSQHKTDKKIKNKKRR